MPTYSYLCDACGGSFEIEQRISEDPIKQCSLCGKSQARRQIVSGNFILKGGGWYSDGYGSASKSKSAAATSSSDGSSSSSTKPETKTETKPETGTKTETKPETGTKPVSKAAAAE
jgi:putative FmdB family regulatory protein